MKEPAIWIFLFGTLSVYPFFPLRHVPVMGRLTIPFRKLMGYATLIMVVQGLSYLWLETKFPFGSPGLTWHRKLFMIPYVLLTLRYSKDSKSKTLFMDFFMVGIVMTVIDLAYMIDRTWFAQAFSLAPNRTDVLVRSTLTLFLYPPLYVLFKKILRPIMEIQSMTRWRYMTAIPFVFGVISIITTMEAFHHEISPVILAIRISIIGGSVLVCTLLGTVVKQMEAAFMAQEKSRQAQQFLAMQRAQYKALSKNIEQTKAARHDLRHQLAVIRSYNENGEQSKLAHYLDTLISEIPDGQGAEYCENMAVNAIVSHYAALARQNGVELSVKLTVPESGEKISDTSLCVIFGNLLENAIEGCGRVGDGMTDGTDEMDKTDKTADGTDKTADGMDGTDKTADVSESKGFIRLYSRLQYNTLTITMDNSFDGNAFTREGRFLSRKHGDFGIGTASITAVAEKHGGGAEFETDGMVFKSSVYVRV